MDLIEIFGSYTSWRVDEGTWIINYMNGSQNIYLLEGDDNALLIDTGWGTGNLRAYVEKLTDKPILVANTHGHLDHSGGNGEWERVMMLPGCAADTYTCCKLPFDISKLPFPNYEKQFVKDGDIIDLGNRPIELLEISAHSNGSLAFLDYKNGFLFVGDELESHQVLMYETMPIPGFTFDTAQRLCLHHENMMRLRSLKDQWNTLFPAHNGAPIAHSYLDDYIALVEHIYAGDAIIEDKLNHPYAEADDPEHRLCRVRWGSASFFINKAEMMTVWGTKDLKRSSL